ncbi:citrate synthase [Roseibium hamelinense]|nr:citrate synthase [Roseibium hamelinense]
MRPVSSDPIHTQIANAWQAPANAKNVLRAALVLSADHEFNTSTFATRCAASTRAPLHAALLSGLGAFMGPRHGASSDRVSGWLWEVKDPKDVERVLTARLTRGDGLPGFGHQIYKSGDPRADCLLDMIMAFGRDSPFLEVIPELRAQGQALFGLSPNIDFALASAQRTFNFPQDAGKVLFCTGRMVGWIAHALEQYETNAQIRPRATYIGDRPR